MTGFAGATTATFAGAATDSEAFGAAGGFAGKGEVIATLAVAAAFGVVGSKDDTWPADFSAIVAGEAAGACEAIATGFITGTEADSWEDFATDGVGGSIAGLLID